MAKFAYYPSDFNPNALLFHSYIMIAYETSKFKFTAIILFTYFPDYLLQIKIVYATIYQVYSFKYSHYLNFISCYLDFKANS